jgi:hypothetical protein
VVVEGWGDGELDTSMNGDGGPERTGVGTFGESVGDRSCGGGG